MPFRENFERIARKSTENFHGVSREFLWNFRAFLENPMGLLGKFLEKFYEIPIGAPREFHGGLVGNFYRVRRVLLGNF